MFGFRPAARWMRRLLLVIFAFSLRCAAFLDDYYCGVGSVSKTLSYVASVPCGHDSLNQCCQRHDQCYDEGYAPKLCDKEFCECVKSSQMNYFCSKWLSFTHCQPVKALGSALGRLAVAEWKSNEEAFERWKHRYRDYANRKRNRTSSAAPENTTDPMDSRESALNVTQAMDDDDINRTIIKERPLSRPERSIIDILDSA